jgi:ribosome biogenesis protein MAK21
VAVQAGYLLGAVLAEHPGMKAVVVAEVQRFMFRPGLQERARYYAVVFLNQLQLSHHPTHGAHPLPPAACHSVDKLPAACLCR